MVGGGLLPGEPALPKVVNAIRPAGKITVPVILGARSSRHLGDVDDAVAQMLPPSPMIQSPTFALCRIFGLQIARLSKSFIRQGAPPLSAVIL